MRQNVKQNTNIFNEKIDVVEQNINNISPILLNILLKDNSTKQNTVWATSSYEKYGPYFFPEKQMLAEQLVGPYMNLLTPRVSKEENEQLIRTKQKGEVFTPAWICNAMINFIDDDWFGRKEVFNVEINNGWISTNNLIEFTEDKSWEEYINNTRMEITCGEATIFN